MSTNGEGSPEKLQAVWDSATQSVKYQVEDPEGYNPEAARIHRNVALMFFVVPLLILATIVIGLAISTISQGEIDSYSTAVHELARPYVDRAVDYVQSWQR